MDRRSAAASMKTHVEFRTDAFPPRDDEELEIDSGRWGKRLADFLVQGLRSKGIEAAGSVGEDWGWIIDVKNRGFRLWIGCGNYEEYDNAFLCFIEPHKPFVRPFPFLKRIAAAEKVEVVRRAIDELLRAHPAIRDIRWWTYEEFNKPAASATDCSS